MERQKVGNIALPCQSSQRDDSIHAFGFGERNGKRRSVSLQAGLRYSMKPQWLVMGQKTTKPLPVTFFSGTKPQ